VNLGFLENDNMSRKMNCNIRPMPFRPRRLTAALWLTFAGTMLAPLMAQAQSAGITDLGTLSGGDRSRAFGVSANGAVVVGGATITGLDADYEYAFRWTEAGGMQSLGVLNGGDFSRANGASADGAVVIGVANDGAMDGNGRAFLWTQAGGMQSLGELNGGTSSNALGRRHQRAHCSQVAHEIRAIRAGRLARLQFQTSQDAQHHRRRAL